MFVESWLEITSPPHWVGVEWNGSKWVKIGLTIFIAGLKFNDSIHAYVFKWWTGRAAGHGFGYYILHMRYSGSQNQNFHWPKREDYILLAILMYLTQEIVNIDRYALDSEQLLMLVLLLWGVMDHATLCLLFVVYNSRCFYFVFFHLLGQLC